MKKSKYANVLNALDEMSQSFVYAARRSDLTQAESIIVSLEQERDALTQRLAAVEARLDRYAHWTPEHTIDEWLANRQRIVDAKQAEADAQLQAENARLREELDSLNRQYSAALDRMHHFKEQLAAAQGVCGKDKPTEARVENLQRQVDDSEACCEARTKAEQRVGKLEEVLDYYAKTAIGARAVAALAREA